MKKEITIVFLLLGCFHSNAQTMPKVCREYLSDIEQSFRNKLARIQKEKSSIEQELYNYRSGKIKPAPNVQPGASDIACKEDYYRRQYIFVKNKLKACQGDLTQSGKQLESDKDAFEKQLEESQKDLAEAMKQNEEKDEEIQELVKEIHTKDSVIVFKTTTEKVATEQFGKNSLHVFAEYNPTIGKKRYVPLDKNNPIMEAANLDQEVNLNPEKITKLIVVGNLLVDSEAEKLSGKIILRIEDTSVSKPYDFEKQSVKIGNKYLYTCRYDDENLIWEKVKKKKKITKLKRNQTYEIKVECQGQSYSTTFRIN